MTKNMFGMKVFFMGITDKQFFFNEYGKPLRVFERNSDLSIRLKKRRFTDSGNMQTTISQGWEANVSLPGNESYKWRIYDSLDGYPEQLQHLTQLMRMVDVC